MHLSNLHVHLSMRLLSLLLLLVSCTAKTCALSGYSIEYWFLVIITGFLYSKDLCIVWLQYRVLVSCTAKTCALSGYSIV